MAEKIDKDALRITNQFRAKRGMVYDLKCDGDRLTIGMSPRETEGDLGEWRVEARTSHAPDALVVAAWGATRTEALRAVGLSWVEQAPAHGLPKFDWDAVARALGDVRAL